MTPPLSRLMLGTAQFGQAYGIANRSGAPKISEICGLLETAAAAGINALDTAHAYGDSERVLGQALRETGLGGHFQIVTKTNSRLAADLTAEEARQAVRASIEESLSRLGVTRVPIVLLHRDTAPAHLEALSACRDAGLVGLCGVSSGNPENARAFLSSPDLRAIQAPVNVLDHRFDGVIAEMKNRGGLVFARSCYLQGLLLLSDETTPAHLRPVIPARSFFQSLAKENGLPLPDLLLGAMLARPAIDCVVVGMENLAQLQENIRIFQAPPLPSSLVETINSFHPEIPSWLVDPPQWPSRAQASA